MKSFVYLYPIPEYIDQEIEGGFHRLKRHDLSEKKQGLEFRKVYREKLNECINERYRKNDFQINWAVFNHHEISDIIELRKEDRIVEVGMDFDTHCIQLPDKSYRYPDNDYILDKLGIEQGAFSTSEQGASSASEQGASSAVSEHLMVAGFHIFDCVEKFAKQACERGIDTLIDEDLTQFFKHRMFDKDFKTNIYQPRDISKMEGIIKEGFINARKGKSYFLQDYR